MTHTRTTPRHNGKALHYIGRHRSMFITYLDTTYTPRHGAGLIDADVAA